MRIKKEYKEDRGAKMIKINGKYQEQIFQCDICELEFRFDFVRGRPPAYCPACRTERAKERSRLRQKKRQDKIRAKKQEAMNQ